MNKNSKKVKMKERLYCDTKKKLRIGRNILVIMFREKEEKKS